MLNSKYIVHSTLYKNGLQNYTCHRVDNLFIYGFIEYNSSAPIF